MGHSRGGVPGFWVQQAGGGLGTLEFKPHRASLDLCQEAEKIDFFPEWPSLRSRGRAGPRRSRRGTLLAWQDALGEALDPHRWARPGGKGLGNAAWLSFLSFVCVTLNKREERQAQWGISAATEHLLLQPTWGLVLLELLETPSLMFGDCSRQDEQKRLSIVVQIPGHGFSLPSPAFEGLHPPCGVVPPLSLGLAGSKGLCRAQVGPPPVLEQRGGLGLAATSNLGPAPEGKCGSWSRGLVLFHCE